MVKGKELLMRKPKMPPAYLRMQRESAEEQPLVVTKVIRQYTRKKKVPTSSIPINMGALSSGQSDSKVLIANHVKIKEELMEVDFIIEENNLFQNEVSKQGNGFKIKEENEPDIVNCKVVTAGKFTDKSYKHSDENNYVNIKKEDESETQVKLTGIGLHQSCSDKKENTINIKENVPKIRLVVAGTEIGLHQNCSNKNDNTINMKENVPKIRVVDDGHSSNQNDKHSKSINAEKYSVKRKKRERFKSETQINLTQIDLNQNCSNNDSTIKIKEENPYLEEVQESSELGFTIKTEPIEHELYKNMGQKNINAEGSKSDVNKAIETPNVDIISFNSNNVIMESSTIDKCMVATDSQNISNHSYTKTEGTDDTQKEIPDEKNILELQISDKILITEEIHIKEEIITNTDMDCIEAENNKSPLTESKKTPLAESKNTPLAESKKTPLAESKKSPLAESKKTPLAESKKTPETQPGNAVVKTTQLKRIMNVPKILRTYGKKQPDPVTLKKCFIIAVSSPSGKKTTIDPQKPLYNCETCNRNFYSHASFRTHMQTMHVITKRHRCPSCSARFPFHYQLLAHSRFHSGAPLACALCPHERFLTRNKFGNHLNTHLRERMFPCPVCLRRYPVLDVLHRHVERHTPEDNFTCDTCKGVFTTAIELRRHSERDHSAPTDFPCYICSRVFASRADFLAHANSHDDARIECTFCSKSFDEAEMWERHCLDHIEKARCGEETPRPYACKHCKKTFVYQSVLRSHLKMHSKERPYACAECGQRLKTRSALTEHENGHKRPFPCPRCGWRFGRRDSLNRHMLLHTGDRPFACASCPLTFVQRSAMVLHTRRFHDPSGKRKPKMCKK